MEHAEDDRVACFGRAGIGLNDDGFGCLFVQYGEGELLRGRIVIDIPDAEGGLVGAVLESGNAILNVARSWVVGVGREVVVERVLLVGQ